jgi:aromatic-L-amino-acid/L-tryptophan decarboxylase
MRYFGRDGIVAILPDKVTMAKGSAERIAADPRFKLVAPVGMNLVCFQLHRGDKATQALINRLNASRHFFVSHTVLRNRFVIRVAIGNIRTRQTDVEDLWTAIQKNVAELC